MTPAPERLRWVAFRLARAGEAPSLWSRTIDRPGGRMWAMLLAVAISLLMLFALARYLLRARQR